LNTRLDRTARPGKRSRRWRHPHNCFLFFSCWFRRNSCSYAHERVGVAATWRRVAPRAYQEPILSIVLCREETSNRNKGNELNLVLENSNKLF